jgi:hypothetical protein
VPNPRFQNGLSDQFGAPGTYIKELAVSAPVRGIFLGNTGMVFESVRGPVGRVVICNSLQRFIDVYGGRDKGINGGAVIGKGWFALQSKQFGLIYGVRVAASDAVVASFTLETATGGGGTAVLRVDASSVGTWGNDVAVKVVNASNGVTTSFNLLAQNYGKNYLFENIDISSTNDNTAVVVGTDDAVVITLTKLAAGRPVNSTASTDGADANGFIKLGQTAISGFTGVAGSDGTIADTDYTGAGKAMEIMHQTRGVGVMFVAGKSNTNIKTKILALSSTANTWVWLACPDTSAITVASAITEVATLRSSRISYCFNHPTVVDPVTGVRATDEPHTWMASILSQIEPDVHPGVVDTATLTTGIVTLAYEIGDPDADSMDAAGVTFLNRDLDQAGNVVWLFRNGLTTDLTTNNRQLDGQRMKFFLVGGLAQRMRGDEKKPNTPVTRAARKAAFEAWLTELANAGRFVNTDDAKRPLFEVKNDAQVNAPSDVQAGIQRDLVRVQLIPKNLYLQLQVQIGVNVVNFSFQ